MGTKVDALLADWDTGKMVSESMDALKQSLKSEEELQIFTLADDISEFDRVCVLIDSQHLIQKASGIQSILYLFKQNHRMVADKIFPKLLKDNILHNMDSGLQIMIAETVTSCIETKILTPKQVVEYFLPSMLNMLQGRSDGDVTNAWSNTLVSAMGHLPPEVLKGKIVEFVVSKSDLSNLVSTRVIAAKIMGALASYLDPHTIESTFFRRCLMLCQDTDYEVRATICQQLEFIAKGVGPNVSQADLIYELQELLKDEETSVKNAAFQTFVNLADFFDKKIKKDVIIPQFKTFCLNPPEDMITIISKLFGEMLFRVANDFEDEDEAMVFYNFFKLLAKRPDFESRKNSAYNFPAVIKCMGARRYALNLHDTFSQLIKDSYALVRRTMACGFHKVATILGKERCVKYLKESFLYLLQDDSIEVKLALADHFDQILSMFSISNEDQKYAIYCEFLPLIMDYQTSIMKNWRVTQVFLSQIMNIPEYYTSDQIYEYFVPLVFRLMEEAPAPVKESATKNICLYIRKNRKNYQRSNICAQLVQRFGRKKCCYNRLVYVDICISAMDMFSRKFFREHFFDAAIDLGRDSVPNVRLKFCKLAPYLRRILRGPYDEPAIRRLDDIMETLMGDKDKDVCEAARQTMSQIQIDLTNNRNSPSSEAADKKKEEEEKAVLANADSSDYDGGRRELDFDKGRMDFRKRFGEPADSQGSKGKYSPAKPTGKFSSAPPGRPPSLSSDVIDSRLPSTTKLSLPSALKKSPFTGQGAGGLTGTSSGSPNMSASSSSSSVSSLSTALNQPGSTGYSASSGATSSLLGKLPRPTPSGTPSTSTLPNGLGKLSNRESDFTIPKVKGAAGRQPSTPPKSTSSYTSSLPSVPTASRSLSSKPSVGDRGIRSSLDNPQSDYYGSNLSSNLSMKSERAASITAKLERTLNNYMNGVGATSSSASVGSGAAGYESSVSSGMGRNRRF